MRSKVNMPGKGLLIAIEGIDGAGTTTQTARISAWLRRSGIAVLRTAEPSRGPVGRHIRKILRRGEACLAPTPQELALLFAADRLDHVEREIKPALIRGVWVITDRYRLSSLAYQSIECDPDWVVLINRHAQPADLSILIDIPVKMALTRLASRGGEPEMFETARLLERIRRMYLKCAKRTGDGRIVIVDGAPPAKEVSIKIKESIRSFHRI